MNFTCSAIANPDPRSVFRWKSVIVKKIYVGNLPWSCGDAELKEFFSAIGEVHSAAVITDRETGRSRGFGFTGGHFHRNWKEDNFRKVMLNAIV